MIDKYFEWNIDGVQANTILDGAKVKIDINKQDYKDIFINKELVKLLIKNDEYIRMVFDSENKIITDSICHEFHLSYLTNDNSYYLGFDYKQIFTNVLSKLGVDGVLLSSMKLPNKITNKEEFYSFIDTIERTINKDTIIKNELPFEVTNDGFIKNDLIEKLSINLKDMLKSLVSVEHQIKKAIDAQTNEEKNLRNQHKALYKSKENHINWKNLMYYTSIKAIDEFKYNNDLNYYRYAKNYYKNVSTNPKAEMPNGIYVDGDFYDCHYILFNKRFLAIRNHMFPEILIRLNIEDKDTITVRKVLKNGKGMKGAINPDNPKEYKKIDYSRINETLGRKIKFYQGLSGKVQGIINGLDTDTDYIGYVFDNNYVVFDKFYDVSKDGTKAVPSYGAGVYVVTLDVLEDCERDRSKIRKYIRENHNYKAFKFNHNDTDSYQEKIKKVSEYEDVSITKFKELKLKNYENKKRG